MSSHAFAILVTIGFSAVGAVYSVSMIVLLTAIGALCLLMRFAWRAGSA